jgi:phospholipid-binding lipoprotein MlaA
MVAVLARARPGDPSDPFETANRTSYVFSSRLDKAIIRPVAMTYRRVLPRPIRNAFHNAIGNWDEPVVFVNDILQIRLSDAARTAGRFVLNSTVGVVGILDVAKSAGLAHHDNGFTITMGRYGVRPGPYLYLPVLGPSSTRDIVGASVDLFTNPLTAIRHIRSRKVELAQNVVSAVDARAGLEDDLQTLNETAADPYAFVRSTYQQHIQAQIAGDEISLDPIPDLAPLPSAPKP